MLLIADVRMFPPQTQLMPALAVTASIDSSSTRPPQEFSFRPSHVLAITEMETSLNVLAAQLRKKL